MTRAELIGFYETKTKELIARLWSREAVSPQVADDICAELAERALLLATYLKAEPMETSLVRAPVRELALSDLPTKKKR